MTQSFETRAFEHADTFEAHVTTMSSKSRLFWWMQAINVFSVLFLLAPTLLRSVVNIDDFLSREFAYTHSIEPFIPAALLDLFTIGNSLPVQAIQLGSLTIYFPGVAIECIFGVVQGIWLGMDLLNTPRRGNYQTPSLPATALFLYAGMCLSAFPIHCLKSIAMFDLESQSVVATSLQWLDTWCTSCVPGIALLVGLIECNLAEPSHERFMPLILAVNAFLTWLGAFLPNRWTTFTLHALIQFAFVIPLVHLTNQRTSQLSCPHGFKLMKLGKYVAIATLYCIVAFIAILSITTEGCFCPLASVFVVSRIATVEYWAFSKSQADCNCNDNTTKKKND